MAMDYNNSFISRYPVWNSGATLEIGGARQPVRIIEVIRGEAHCSNLTTKTTITCTFAGDLNGLVKTALNSVYGLKSPIKKVIFNDPATIVYWTDGTKTIVKCNDGDTYSPERGLLMAIAKKFLGGNAGRYNNELRKWLPDMGTADE